MELSQLETILSDHSRLENRWGQLPEYVHFASRILRERPPKKASIVVAVPMRRGVQRVEWQEFVAIASFRTPFSVIEELARILAPFATETGIVPLIRPTHRRRLEELDWSSRYIRELVDNGALISGSKRT